MAEYRAPGVMCSKLLDALLTKVVSVELAGSDEYAFVSTC